MFPSRASRPPASRRPFGLRGVGRAAGVLRVLRALVCTVPLAWVLGGGCTFVYKSDHDDDDHEEDDGTTVVVQTATSGGEGGPGADQFDPELFRMGGDSALSPTRLWQPEQIGERELAAFAAGVLAVNEERLHLPQPASELQYLDTQVADGVATVRFGSPPMGAGPVVSANFDATGGLVSVDRELR